MRRDAGVGRLGLVGPLALVMLLVVGCSTRREIAVDDEPTETTRLVETPFAEDEEALRTGSAAVAQMQAVIDELLALDDPCEMLTGRQIQSLNLDPTTLASVEARTVLANGIVDIYGKLIEEINDPSVRPSLIVQRDTYVGVLGIINRYSNSAASDAGNAEIDQLIQDEDFLAAQNAVGEWVFRNCG